MVPKTAGQIKFKKYEYEVRLVLKIGGIFPNLKSMFAAGKFFENWNKFSKKKKNND